MDSLDRITRQRAAALLLYGLSFAIWQTTQLETIKTRLGSALPDLLAPLCILLWLASAGFLIWQSRRHGRRSGGDELSRAYRARALAAGYWSVTLLAAAGLVAGSRLSAPPIDVLRLLLAVAVTVPALSYFYLECFGDGAQ